MLSATLLGQVKTMKIRGARAEIAIEKDISHFCPFRWTFFVMSIEVDIFCYSAKEVPSPAVTRSQMRSWKG